MYDVTACVDKDLKNMEKRRGKKMKNIAKTGDVCVCVFGVMRYVSAKNNF